MNEKVLKVVLGLVDQLTPGLKKIASQGTGNLKTLEQQAGKTKASLVGLDKSIKTLFTVFASMWVVQKFAGWLGACTKEAMADEQAMAKLSAGLARVKNEFSDSRKVLVEQANALQDLTGYQDDSIINAQAMLTTFMLNDKAVHMLTPRILDMAAALDKAGEGQADLQTLSIAVGKAVTGSTGVLARYGITLTDVQKKALETAKGMERVKLITEILDQNFQGTAQTVGTTYYGAVERLKRGFDNLIGTIGSYITQNDTVRTAIVLLGEWVNQTTGNMETASTGVHQFVKNLVISIATLVKEADLLVKRMVKGWAGFMGTWSFAKRADIEGWEKGWAGAVSRIEQGKPLWAWQTNRLVSEGKYFGMDLTQREINIISTANKGAADYNAIKEKAIKIAQKHQFELIGEANRLDDVIAGYNELLKVPIEDFAKEWDTRIQKLKDTKGAPIGLPEFPGGGLGLFDTTGGDGKGFQSTLPNQQFLNKVQGWKNVFNAIGDVLKRLHDIDQATKKNIETFQFFYHLINSIKAAFADARAQAEKQQFAQGAAFGQWLMGKDSSGTYDFMGKIAGWAKKGFTTGKWFGGGKTGGSKSGMDLLGSNDFLQNMFATAIGSFAGGGWRSTVASVLPMIGGAFNPVLGAIGGLIGGLFGRKKDRGTTPDNPVYVKDVKLETSLDALANISKAMINMMAGRAFDRAATNTSLRYTALRIGAI